jgi:pimeloyl-ACP methyl ester carboxylesterase
VRNPEHGWLERDGVSLHYLEWQAESPGPREPAILLLHGLSSNARYWSRVAEHITDRRLIALDQRGHGMTGRPPSSPKVPDGYGMDELVADASFVASELGLGRPVVVGHSWGATVALEVVGTRPGLASGLVFIDGPVQSPSNMFTWEDAQEIMQPPLPRFASLADAFAASQADFGEAWGKDLEAFVGAGVVVDGDELILTLTAPARYELLKGLFESQPDVLWPSISIPAATLLGLRSFVRVARSKEGGAVRLAEIAPSVEVRWFDAPHDIPIWMPNEVAAEIERVAEIAADAGGSEATAG